MSKITKKMTQLLDLFPELFGIILSFLSLRDKMSFVLSSREIYSYYYERVMNEIKNAYLATGLRKLMLDGDLDGIKYFYIAKPELRCGVPFCTFETSNMEIFDYCIKQSEFYPNDLEALFIKSLELGKSDCIDWMIKNDATILYDNLTYAFSLIVNQNRFDLVKYIIPFNIDAKDTLFFNSLIELIENNAIDFLDYVFRILDLSTLGLEFFYRLISATNALISKECSIFLYEVLKKKWKDIGLIFVKSYIHVDRVELIQSDFNEHLDIGVFNYAIDQDAFECVKYISEFIKYEDFNLSTMRLLETTFTRIRDFVNEKYL
jgi:hypothetical protein